jgi:hypothetical protein
MLESAWREKSLRIEVLLEQFEGGDLEAVGVEAEVACNHW